VKLKRIIAEKLVELDNTLDSKLAKVTLPGFKEKSVYQVGRFFVNGLFEESLNLRASSLAFNFFIALFPLIIFLFTLIPYIPVTNLEWLIMNFISKVLPANASDFLSETIRDILTNQNAGLLSFGFIAALYFASNGFASLIAAFDQGVHYKFQRNWFDVRLKSVGLLFLVVILLISTLVLNITFNFGLDLIENNLTLTDSFDILLVQFIEVMLTIALVYFTFSSIYYFGSNKETSWHYFTPGSTVATILSLCTTYGFRVYVENFNSYNKLYGSVGTLLVLMLLIYFNCFVILIGYELNRSIDKAS
jgi:membrane protein